MPDPAGFGIGTKIASKFFRPVLAAFQRNRRMGDVELDELRSGLRGLLDSIEGASVSAQLAVMGSSNDPETTALHRDALRCATAAGQRTADFFQFHTVAHQTPALVSARLAFREAVTNEDNPSLVDRVARHEQCETIELACNAFHDAVRDEAFRRWGQGIGAKAGRMNGKKLPK